MMSNKQGLDQGKMDEEMKSEDVIPSIQTLKELIELVSGKSVQKDFPSEDSGIAEILPYPFLALVGQYEMKLALLLSIINPAVGGVLLVGPRGTGKTTAVRSMLKLLPEVQKSACYYGCLPEDVEAGGMDAVCPECAKKYAEGKSLTKEDIVRLVELPLNASLDDVIGRIAEHEVIHERFRLKRGILAQADLNVLYIDEVNLLADDIVNAILDAAANGMYSIRRGALSANFKSRFTLIGTMNPEEGNLRPQIMDRFGLRVVVSGLSDVNDRIEAYHRMTIFRKNPRQLIAQFADETGIARKEILIARDLLAEVIIPDELAVLGSHLVQEVAIDSLRAEFTLFEAARAYAAANARKVVSMDDLRSIAPMTLRLRRSTFMQQYFLENQKFEKQLAETLDRMMPGLDG
jgi:magnesium chelatase subunit I